VFHVTGVQTCALRILGDVRRQWNVPISFEVARKLVVDLDEHLALPQFLLEYDMRVGSVCTRFRRDNDALADLEAPDRFRERAPQAVGLRAEDQHLDTSTRLTVAA